MHAALGVELDPGEHGLSAEGLAADGTGPLCRSERHKNEGQQPEGYNPIEEHDFRHTQNCCHYEDWRYCNFNRKDFEQEPEWTEFIGLKFDGFGHIGIAE